VISQVAEFGWADKGEVSRIEHDNRPFAFQVCIRNGYEFAVVKSIGSEWLNLGINQGHGHFSFGFGDAMEES
jgi:hypothetical protein